MNANRAYVIARRTTLALLLTACGATVGAAGEDDDTPEPGVVETAQDGATGRSEGVPPHTKDGAAVMPDATEEDVTIDASGDADPDPDIMEPMPDAGEDAATEEDASMPVVDAGSEDVQDAAAEAAAPEDAGSPIADAGTDSSVPIVDSGSDSGPADSGGPVDSGADACVPKFCNASMCGSFVSCGVTRNCGTCSNDPGCSLDSRPIGGNGLPVPGLSCPAERPNWYRCGSNSNYGMHPACGAPVWSNSQLNVWWCCP